MVIKIINISPKVGALSADELSNVDIVDLIDGSECWLSSNCNLDDAYTSLICLLVNKFVDDVMSFCKKAIERFGRKFSFCLHYENGRKERGFQLIMDFDNVRMDYQSYLTKYFEWESIKYESDLSFNNIEETILA